MAGGAPAAAAAPMGAGAAGAGAMAAGAGPGAAAAGAGAMGAAVPTGLLEVGEESMAGGMEVRPASGEGTSRVEVLIMAAICRGEGAGEKGRSEGGGACAGEGHLQGEGRERG